MNFTLLIPLLHLINLCLSCSYYAEYYPQPPFKEMARYPIGVCAGTHYYHSKINQESYFYGCSNDGSHVLKYTYTDSSKCVGDHTVSVVTRNPNNFVCDSETTCPYIIIKVHSTNLLPGDWRRWYSTAFVTDTCINNEIYACEDNTGYSHHIFAENNCFGTPQIKYYAADEYESIKTQSNGFYDVFCNHPDPSLRIISMDEPTNKHVQGVEEPTSAIETGICLTGKSGGLHDDIANNMVSYCFGGYDMEGYPVYNGELALIKRTISAGDTYGVSYGIFYPDEAYPVAYCFSDDKDITSCSKQWYVDKGITPKYYLDDSLETMECECTADLTDHAASDSDSDTTSDLDTAQDGQNNIVDNDTDTNSVQSICNNIGILLFGVLFSIIFT